MKKCENTFMLCFRHMRLSADLNNMSWRVRPEEVLIEVGKSYGSKLGLQKLTEVRVIFKNCKQLKKSLPLRNVFFKTFGIKNHRSSITSCNSLPNQMFTTVGIYKGSRVAIKKITKKKVDVNEKLLWEIKQV